MYLPLPGWITLDTSDLHTSSYNTRSYLPTSFLFCDIYYTLALCFYISGFYLTSSCFVHRCSAEVSIIWLIRLPLVGTYVLLDIHPYSILHGSSEY